MEGCGKIVKWILFLLNSLIFVGGLVVLSVGIWTLLDKAFIQRLLRNELFISSAYILIIAGCFVIFFSFMGWFGAIKEVKCMLFTYFICLFLMFVVLVIGGVLGYVFKNQVEHNLRPEMKHTIELYEPNEPNDPITTAWDDTQKNLKCCGMGSSNWENKPWLAWRNNRRLNPRAEDTNVPLSCCKLDSGGQPMNCTRGEEELLYKSDCFTEGLRFVKQHVNYLASVAIGFSCFLILGMIFSICLFKLIE